jgi:hypothetical protein
LRIMRWSVHVACTEEWRGVYRVIVGIPEGKRPLGSPKWRWEGNIKKYLQKWDGGAWTTQIWFKIGTGGRNLFVDVVMNLWVPHNAGNFMTSSEIHKKDSSPQSLSKSVREVPNWIIHSGK